MSLKSSKLDISKMIEEDAPPRVSKASSSSKPVLSKKRPAPVAKSAPAPHESSSEDESSMEENEPQPEKVAAPSSKKKIRRAPTAESAKQGTVDIPESEAMAVVDDKPKPPKRPTKTRRNDFEIYRAQNSTNKDFLKYYPEAKYLGTDGEISSRKKNGDVALTKEEVYKQRKASILKNIAELESTRPEMVPKLKEAFQKARQEYLRLDAQYVAELEDFDRKYPEVSKTRSQDQANDRSHRNLMHKAYLSAWVKNSELNNMVKEHLRVTRQESQRVAIETVEREEVFVVNLLKSVEEIVATGPKPPKRQRMNPTTKNMIEDAPAAETAPEVSEESAE